MGDGVLMGDALAQANLALLFGDNSVPIVPETDSGVDATDH
jgi:hypothetical protein